MIVLNLEDGKKDKSSNLSLFGNYLFYFPKKTICIEEELSFSFFTSSKPLYFPNPRPRPPALTHISNGGSIIALQNVEEEATVDLLLLH